MPSVEHYLRHRRVEMSYGLTDAPPVPLPFSARDRLILPTGLVVTWYGETVVQAELFGDGLKNDGTPGAKRHRIVYYMRLGDYPKWLGDIVKSLDPDARE